MQFVLNTLYMTFKKISIKTKFSSYKDMLRYLDPEGNLLTVKNFCRFRYDIIPTEKLTYYEI